MWNVIIVNDVAYQNEEWHEVGGKKKKKMIDIYHNFERHIYKDAMIQDEGIRTITKLPLFVVYVKGKQVKCMSKLEKAKEWVEQQYEIFGK